MPAAARAELDWVVRLIAEVRTVRAEMNVPPSRLAPILLRDAADEALFRAARWDEQIRRLAARLDGRATGRRRCRAARSSACWTRRRSSCRWPDIIDLPTERARLAKERQRAEQEAEKVVRKLDNADFVGRAPPEVIEENRDRLASARQEIARLEAALQRIA